MIMRDYVSRFSWVHLIFHKKSEATEAFKKFLADLRVEGIPSEFVVVRSDDGGKFNEGKLLMLCRERNIKQELTAADSP